MYQPFLLLPSCTDWSHCLGLSACDFANCLPSEYTLHHQYIRSPCHFQSIRTRQRFLLAASSFENFDFWTYTQVHRHDSQDFKMFHQYHVVLGWWNCSECFWPSWPFPQSKLISSFEASLEANRNTSSTHRRARPWFWWDLDRSTALFWIVPHLGIHFDPQGFWVQIVLAKKH